MENLRINIFNKLKSKCKEFEFYSVAMNESTDAAQVAIFIRGTVRDCATLDKLAQVVLQVQHEEQVCI